MPCKYKTKDAYGQFIEDMESCISTNSALCGGAEGQFLKRAADGVEWADLDLGNEESWNSSADVTSPAQGTGTEADPVLINTCGDLLAIPNTSTLYYKLTTNLDFGPLVGMHISFDKTAMTATVVADDEDAPYYNSGKGILAKNFNGYFDGCGYKIKGWIACNNNNNRWSGLFDQVGNNNNNASVSNLNISGKMLLQTGTGQYGGAICGRSTGGKFVNIYSDMTFYVENQAGNSSPIVGGLCGYQSGSTTLENCEFFGKIVAVKYSGSFITGNGDSYGGILGSGTGSPTIVDCVFSGSIAMGGSGSVGGISAGNTSCTINNCKATGNLAGRTIYPFVQGASSTITSSSMVLPAEAGSFVLVPAGGTNGQLLKWGVSGPEWVTQA